jgi:alanyl-tRNA synthetase
MSSEEIRERFLRFFEDRGHRRLRSASLVPAASDRSVLLTTAGMQPLKPYFLGQESPPAQRLTSCQRCFRAVDIDKVGTTTRHLTFFEMLGNFSIGDYFKREAIQFAWELSLEAFGFDQNEIWVTVFEGSDELGLGPDEDAIAIWQDLGVPRGRIVPCPRSENFWEAGPVGPSGPSSELYLDRGLDFGTAEDLPGGENERFLEYWNLVFMSYNQDPADHLEALPTSNIDTGLGLNRLAAIMQAKDSVFETDQFQPLIELGEQLSGRSSGVEVSVDRSLRVLADHARAMTFLIADGVVPSNEDRGYVLRRVMRRAIQQGRSLGMAPGFLARYAGIVEELMGGVYPELVEQREAIGRWLGSEEESFGHTLEQGLQALNAHIADAREGGRDSVSYEEVFRLHDTFGFPFDLTKELLAEAGLTVDEQGFGRLMDEQRARARAATAASAVGDDARALAQELADASDFTTTFTGYETEEQRTTVGALQPVSFDSTTDAGESAEATRYMVKLRESPFYAVGGGQVSDVGVLECAHGDCRARVEGVFRAGADQALAVVLEEGALDAGEPVLARVDHARRHATERNHTATHLLHAALRETLGKHVRQAGSYVGPDKLRFDFTHSKALSDLQLRAIADRVNEWIAADDPVRGIQTTLEEARRLGAMALFGEKYGDLVRMVEVGDGDYSRELCGGTHVRLTGEIGLFHIVSETSSAANVRRIEAITGPVAVDLMRAHNRTLEAVAQILRTQPEEVATVVAEREQQRRSLEHARRRDVHASGVDVDTLAAQAQEVEGVPVVIAEVAATDAKALPPLVDAIRGKLSGRGAIVLASPIEGRAALIVSVDPELVERGVRAGEIVKTAASVVGGGGGGRDTMAQAGGRDADKLGEALQAARGAIEAALSR